MTRKMSTTMVNVSAAKYRAHSAAPAAANQRPAKHDGREHLQQERRADERIAGSGVGRDEQAGGAEERAGNREREETDEPDIDTLARAATCIASDRVEPDAKAKPLQIEPSQDCERQ